MPTLVLKGPVPPELDDLISSSSPSPYNTKKDLVYIEVSDKTNPEMLRAALEVLKDTPDQSLESYLTSLGVSSELISEVCYAETSVDTATTASLIGEIYDGFVGIFWLNDRCLRWQGCPIDGTSLLLDLDSELHSAIENTLAAMAADPESSEG